MLLPSGITHYIHAFYRQDVAPPKQPGGLAIITWHKGETSKDLELEVFKSRPDIGRILLNTWEPYTEQWVTTVEQTDSNNEGV
jgi:hypothetical protein